MKYRILIFSLTISFILQAEKEYSYSAYIPAVSNSGYYNLELSQEIIGLSSGRDFSDIRLYDPDGKEIPYFVRSESPVQEINRFISFRIIQNTTTDSSNITIIENEEKEMLDRFYIVTRSAEVKKQVRLRGTDQLSTWYIVKQQQDITYSGFKQDGYDILVVDFPKGDYKYYEITLTNDQGSPLEVLNVVKIENSNIYAQLTLIETRQFIKKDSSDKKSYIRFPELKQSYKVSKITFHINNKADYLRSGYIKPDLHRFSLSSQTENVAWFNQFNFSPEDEIVIENKDNPPLTIEKIEFYGLNRYLCAFLDEGINYKIVIEPALQYTRPNYDIIHFREQIPDNLPILRTGALVEIMTERIIPQRETLWIENQVILWSIIVLIGLLLLFICIKMIRDMRKEK